MSGLGFRDVNPALPTTRNIPEIPMCLGSLSQVMLRIYVIISIKAPNIEPYSIDPL